MPLDLLLASNTTQHGRPPLAHCIDEVASLFKGVERVLFVGFAGHDPAEYTARMQPTFDPLGIQLLNAADEPTDFQGIYIGGGNTFRLVDRLYKSGWMERIRRHARNGTPYLGTSAGTNVTTPTLCTTNDMPIVQPPSFETLGLVPFQINPHYLDPDPSSTHKGETRAQRIAEYHQHSRRVVVGLREGTWLRVRGEAMSLAGPRAARVFHTDRVEEVEPGADLSELLSWN